MNTTEPYAALLSRHNSLGMPSFLCFSQIFTRGFVQGSDPRAFDFMARTSAPLTILAVMEGATVPTINHDKIFIKKTEEQTDERENWMETLAFGLAWLALARMVGCWVVATTLTLTGGLYLSAGLDGFVGFRGIISPCLDGQPHSLLLLCCTRRIISFFFWFLLAGAVNCGVILCLLMCLSV